MKPNMKIRARQRGSVLIIGIIMLVVLTLLAISAINMSTAGLRIVNSMQSRGEAMSAAQRCLEQLISAGFAGSVGTVAGTCTLAIDAGKSYNVILGTPCLKQLVGVPNNRLSTDPDSSDKKCRNSQNNAYWSNCADTVWDVSASVNEGFFGTNVSVRQGIATRMNNDAAYAYSQSTSPVYLCS